MTVSQAPIAPTKEQIRRVIEQLHASGGTVSAYVAATWIEAALRMRA